jgi:transcriptional regulator with XRE-family HTH domain
MTPKSADLPRHTVSSQLRDVIESSGLTPTELGRLSGVDSTVISRFFSGEREIRNGTFDKPAAALGLRLVEGAAPKGEGESGEPGDQGLIVPEARRLPGQICGVPERPDLDRQRA